MCFHKRFYCRKLARQGIPLKNDETYVYSELQQLNGDPFCVNVSTYSSVWPERVPFAFIPLFLDVPLLYPPAFKDFSAFCVSASVSKRGVLKL